MSYPPGNGNDEDFVIGAALLVLLIIALVFLPVRAEASPIVHLGSYHTQDMNPHTGESYSDATVGIGYTHDHLTVGMYRNSFYKTTEQRSRYALTPYVSYNQPILEDSGISLSITLAYYGDDGTGVLPLVDKTGLQLIPLIAYRFKKLTVSTDLYTIVHLVYHPYD